GIAKDIGKAEPAVAELLGRETSLRSFILSAFSLSPYLRDTAAVSPSLLATGITEPLEPVLDRLIATARDAWRPKDGQVPTEGDVMTTLRTAKRGLSLLVALAD